MPAISESIEHTKTTTPESLEIREISKRINQELKDAKVPNISCSYRDSSFLLSHLVLDKPILIFRYSYDHCQACIESEIEHITEMFKNDKNDKDQIVTLCTYPVERDFIIFKKTNHIDWPIYRIEMQAFKWSPDNLTTPYYFVLHPDMKADHFFIPSMEEPLLTKKYLQKAKTLLQ